MVGSQPGELGWKLEGVAKPYLCARLCLLGQDAQEVLGEVSQERWVPVPVVH